MRTAALLVATMAALGQSQAWKGLQVDDWGESSFRVRFSLDGSAAYTGPGALDASSPHAAAQPTPIASSAASLAAAGPWANGNLGLKMNAAGGLSLTRGSTLLADISLSSAPSSTPFVDNVRSTEMGGTGHTCDRICLVPNTFAVSFTLAHSKPLLAAPNSCTH